MRSGDSDSGHSAVRDSRLKSASVRGRVGDSERERNVEEACLSRGREGGGRGSDGRLGRMASSTALDGNLVDEWV